MENIKLELGGAVGGRGRKNAEGIARAEGWETKKRRENSQKLKCSCVLQ